ncbi:hypothetical protein BGP_6470 [Beggiatoa sp. PS]|nr:hypothetical protein BGP_6470 [Beggiatoa sp. PS]
MSLRNRRNTPDFVITGAIDLVKENNNIIYVIDGFLINPQNEIVAKKTVEIPSSNNIVMTPWELEKK